MRKLFTLTLALLASFSLWAAEETLTWVYSGINTACTDPSGISMTSSNVSSQLQSSMAASFSNVKTKADASQSGFSSRLQRTDKTNLGENKALVANQYVGASFTVPSGYIFKLKSISFSHCAISTDISARLTISDGETSVTPNDGTASSGSSASISYNDNDMTKELSGDVTIKIWFWMPGSTSTGKYAGLGDLVITGDLEESSSDPVAVTAITITPSSATIKVGKTVTLGATVTPANATDKAVTWAITSGGAYASVGETTGVVTGLAVGTATITATAHDGSGITQTATITVEECPTSGTVFSMDITASTGTTYTGNNTFPALIDATYVGGQAYSGAKNSTNRTVTIDANGEYPFSENSELAIKVVMDCDLEEGDVINITTSSTRQIKIQKVVGTDLYKTANKTFTIPSGSSLIGENEFYLMRDNGESTLKSFSVVRYIYRTITFNSNGGSEVTALTVRDGEVAEKPADPERGKYTFLGWFVGDTDTEYNWESAVTGDITLKAHWQDPWTITFDEDGGSDVADITVKHNTKAEKPADPTKDNFDFNGWYIDDTNNPFDWDANVTANYSLKAHWLEVVAKYDIEYYDGETKIGTEEQVRVDQHPTATGINTKKDFHTFNGWYNNADLADEHAVDLDDVVPSEGLKLYGKWTKVYSSSINIEQWVLDNGKKNTEFRALLNSRSYVYSNINDLDSLNDDKSNRNYAFLGQKMKAANASISLLLQSGKTVKIRFGNVGADFKIYEGETANTKTSSALANAKTTDSKVYEYTAAADIIIKIENVTADKTLVVKQIMINENIQDVTLPDTPTGIDNTADEIKAVKFVENGQLFIRRGEKVYTITGELVK